MVTVFTVFLVFVEVVCCLLLLGVILLQRSKDHGLGGLAFGSGVGESLFGARVGNVLTRTTVILAVIFLVTTTLLARLGASRRSHSSVMDHAKSRGPMPTMPASQPGPVAPQNIPPPVEVPSPSAPAPIPAPVPVDK